MSHTPDQFLDTSGLQCPMPIMKAGKVLRQLQAGQILHMIATDPAAVEDVKTMCEGSGDALLESSQDSGKYHFYIQKKG